jgi:hypothetical protein
MSNGISSKMDAFKLGVTFTEFRMGISRMPKVEHIFYRSPGTYMGPSNR